MDGFHHLFVVLTLVSCHEISSSAEDFVRLLSVGWPGREQPMRRLTSTSSEPITASNPVVIRPRPGGRHSGGARRRERLDGPACVRVPGKHAKRSRAGCRGPLCSHSIAQASLRFPVGAAEPQLLFSEAPGRQILHSSVACHGHVR